MIAESQAQMQIVHGTRLLTQADDAGCSPVTTLSRPLGSSLRVVDWLKIGLISGLLVALFRFNLARLWVSVNPFNGDPNWGHACFVPVISLWYLYSNRQQLLSAPVKTARTGLAVLLGGIGLFFYGVWPLQSASVQDVAMVVALAGIVLFLAGWEVMKVAWFPVAFLLCAVPWPAPIYGLVATPLQYLAGHVATGTLCITGVDAQLSGTNIYIAQADGSYRVLQVGEACAGLRSLTSFFALGAAVAFLFRRPPRRRIVITLSTIPIAVLCNVTRVAGDGLLDHYVSQKLSEGFYHEFVGVVMLVPAFLLILGVAWVLDHLFIREADGSAKKPAGPASQSLSPRGAGQAVESSSRGPAVAPPLTALSSSKGSTRFSTRGHGSFLVTVGVLLLSAAALHGATGFLHVTFAKRPVPLARPLEALPARLGHWRQVSDDEPLSKALEDSLGTNQYVLRDYLDESRVATDTIARLEAAPPEKRKAWLARARETQPGAIISLAVTYYTGAVDVVGHVPDRCYVADGYQPGEYEVVPWAVGGREIWVRFISFADRTGISQTPRTVAYFFHVNGRYESDMGAVGRSLRNPFEKFGYYVKIEVMTTVEERKEASRAMIDFLSAALPDLERSLPDWAGAERGK